MSVPPNLPSPRELRDILNYTIVALVGMLGGFIIGYLVGHGVQRAPAVDPPPVTRPADGGRHDWK